MFGRATIRLGIGPHSSFISFFPIVDICLSCEDIDRQSCAMVSSASSVLSLHKSNQITMSIKCKKSPI